MDQSPDGTFQVMSARAGGEDKSKSTAAAKPKGRAADSQRPTPRQRAESGQRGNLAANIAAPFAD
jgi:hypothetical protein